MVVSLQKVINMYFRLTKVDVSWIKEDNIHNVIFIISEKRRREAVPFKNNPLKNSIKWNLNLIFIKNSKSFLSALLFLWN